MAWSCDIDGTDITRWCQQITWRPKLSRPASCVVRVPGNRVTATEGVSELHLYNGSLLFSGPVWFIQDDGSENATYSEITAYDHLIYLNKRMCKTPASWPANNFPIHPPDPAAEPGPCNLADPSKVITDFVTAPAIMAAFINATLDCDPPATRGGPGGPWPITVGSVAAGGPDMTGAPADFPMNIQDMADLLLSTGQLNMIVNPGFGSSSIDLTNGGVENDLSGSVSLQYQTGSFNSRGATRTRDMEDVTNALWYLLGPKRHWYEQDISHWAGSITPTAPNAGPNGDGGEPGASWPAPLVARWMGSQASYGYMQEIQIHDEKEDEQTTARPLFQEMYANEAYLRAVPRTFATVRQNRSNAAPSFMPGDLISLSAGTRLGGGFTGTELVYEYEITVDVDGVGEFTDLVTSADGL